MISYWALILGLPLLALGGGAVFFFERTLRLLKGLQNSNATAALLTVVAWIWTAYECDTIGIDVFDLGLKRFPGELWLLAFILTILTILWMRPNLVVRSFSGILMLIPAELFKVTRLLLPESGFAAVHLFVVTAYIGAIIGMYGMFYPWRIKRAMGWVFARRARALAFGFICALWGLSLILIGFTL